MIDLFIVAQDIAQEIVQEVAPVADTAAVDLLGSAAVEGSQNYGWSEILMIMLIGFGLVFSVLVLLIFVIKLFGIVFKGVNKRKAAANVALEAAAVVAPTGGVSDAEVAAIAAALYFEERSACCENAGVLTLKPRTTQWNSKILTFTNLPERK